MKQYRLEELEVYQLSMEFGENIWDIAINWSFLAQDTIGKQMIRSSDSIAANIAEGYGRFHYKENKQFCYYSRGSVLETKTWLRKANSRKLITEDQHSLFITKLETIHIKLNAYIKSIGKQSLVP
ncbi:MAG: four helix bundle protein [Bacteroidota bacterium]|nr:four helix bundle protein [Bacteroidia bacterium]